MALNFSELFSGGNFFGGSEPEMLSLPGLYSKEQAQAARDNARRQAVFSMAAKLMEAGDYSTKPRTLGSALAGGVMAGQQAYQNALNSNMTNRMNTLKMAEVIKGMQRDQQMRQYGSRLYKTPIKLGPMTDSTSQVGRELISQGVTGTDPEDLAFQAQNLAMTSEALNQNRNPGDAGYQPLSVGEPTLDTSVLARMNALDPKATGEYLANYKTMTELKRPTIQVVDGVAMAISPDGKSATPITTRDGRFTGEYQNIAVKMFGGNTTMDGINKWIEAQAASRGLDPKELSKELWTQFDSAVNAEQDRKRTMVNTAAPQGDFLSVLAKDYAGGLAGIKDIEKSNRMLGALYRAIQQNDLTGGTLAQARAEGLRLISTAIRAAGGDSSKIDAIVNRSDIDKASTASTVLATMAQMGGARGFAQSETQILVDAFTNQNMTKEARLAVIAQFIANNNAAMQAVKDSGQRYRDALAGKRVEDSIVIPSLTDVVGNTAPVNPFAAELLRRGGAQR